MNTEEREHKEFDLVFYTSAIEETEAALVLLKEVSDFLKANPELDRVAGIEATHDRLMKAKLRLYWAATNLPPLMRDKNGDPLDPQPGFAEWRAQNWPD